MKTIQKSDFRQSDILDLAPNKSVLVQCKDYSECESTVVMAYQAKRRKPREDVKHYKTEKDIDNYTVLITAIPPEEEKR